jgi:hypothetical protein
MVIGTTGRAYAVPLAGEVETIDSWNGTLWQLRRSLDRRGTGNWSGARPPNAQRRSPFFRNHLNPCLLGNPGGSRNCLGCESAFSPYVAPARGKRERAMRFLTRSPFGVDFGL